MNESETSVPPRGVPIDDDTTIMAPLVASGSAPAAPAGTPKSAAAGTGDAASDPDATALHPASEHTIVRPGHTPPRVRPRGEQPADEEELTRLAQQPEATTIRPAGASALGGAWTPAGPRATGNYVTGDQPGADGSPWTRVPVVGWEAPVERFVAPPPDTPRRRRGVPVRHALGWLVGVLVLGMTLGWVWVGWLRPAHDDDRANVAVAQHSTGALAESRGDQVVRAYLTALAAGHIAQAVQMGADAGSGDAALISEAAWAETLKVAPITHVDVPQQDASQTTIQASYYLGGRQVQRSFAVQRRADLSWQLVRSVTSVTFSSDAGGSVPLLVNGKRVALDHPYSVVPGLYRVQTGLPFLSYRSEDTLEVDDLPAGTQQQSVQVQLTDSGAAAVRGATTSAISTCQLSTQLAPPNCPFRRAAVPGVTYKQVKWTVLTPPVNPDTHVALAASDASVGQMTIIVDANLYVVLVKNGHEQVSPTNESKETWRVSTSLLATTATDLHPVFTLAPG